MGYLRECLELLLRWLHVIAAIAWIGESFYFVALDNGLRPPKPGTAPEGVAGESWSVHGGGFYNKQKYLVAPAVMPEVLHWSKWKSYTTWLSGFGLFSALYLSQPKVFLVDPAVSALSPGAASGVAVGFLVVGWLVYDRLCKLVGFHDDVLGILVGFQALIVAYAATHLFAGRAAFLLTGAVMATIMSANVFFVIIPGQKKMVAAMARGETPDPVYGKRGKQRSVHNTYFTLPVVFTMISNHYASTYSQPDSWAILALWMLAGMLIRQFFVLHHAGRDLWALPIVGGLLIVGALLWMKPATPEVVGGPPVSFDEVQSIVAARCLACHAAHPTSIAVAPKGLMFDDPDTIKLHAAEIYQQVFVLKQMPLGNVTHITDEERRKIARWYQGQR
jgi:uncharacterized membrane protein